MKIWIVEKEIISEIDEWTPSTTWNNIEKVFDSEDKAVSYVQERIKNAINDHKDCFNGDLRYISDHIPTRDEALEITGYRYMIHDDIYTDYHKYFIIECDVE